MKNRYLIPLLLAYSQFLYLLNVLLQALATGWAFRFGMEFFGNRNALSLFQPVAICVSALTGLLALPVGYIAQKRSSLYGVALAVLGLMMIINPWNPDALSMFRKLWPEFLAYILSCWSFWHLGAKFRNRKTPNQVSESTSEPAQSVVSSSTQG